MTLEQSVDLQVAIVGAVATIAVAAIAMAGTWLSNRRTRDRIGDPNGHGSVVAMLVEVLSRQDRQDDEIAKLKDGQTEQASRQANLEGRVSVIEKAVTIRAAEPPTKETA